MFETKEKLYGLSKACNVHSSKIAIYVMYAIERHIMTGRATKQFEENFLQFPDENFSDLIDYCLERDLSNDGIIKSVKHFIKNYKI